MPVLRGLKPPSKGNYTAYILQSVVLQVYIYIQIRINRRKTPTVQNVYHVIFRLTKKLSNEYSLLQTLMLNVTPNQIQVFKYTLHMNNLNQTIISLKRSKIQEC